MNIFNSSMGESKVSQSQGNLTVQVVSTNATSASYFRGMEMMKQMSVGSVITGEIVKIEGNEVSISLGNNAMLSAKMSQGMNLILGQLLAFEVGKNTSSQMALRPLYMNMEQNPTIVKALNAANMQITQDTMQMVDQLMKNGMQINKESLNQVYQLINDHWDVNPNTLMQMNHYHIPVTPENIQQFQAYQNYTHQITSAVETSVDLLLNQLNLVGNQRGLDASNPLDVYGKLTEFLTKDGVVQSDASQTSLYQVSGDSLGGDSIIGNLLGDNLNSVLKDDLNSMNLVSTEQVQTKEVVDTFMQVLQKGELNQEISPKQLFQDLNEFIMGLKTSSMDDSSKAMMLSQLKQLFQNDDVKILIRRELFEQLLIKPHEVGEEGKITEFYNKTYENTQKLLEVFKDAKVAPDFSNAVTNLRSNIEFMHHLNQTFNYVQLPINRGEEFSNGELYVYTNKKNMSNADGSIRALLHFDMDHLGPVDIYVVMQNESVSTNFYLKDDETIDFIGQRIEQLTSRLNDKGFTVKTGIHKKEALTESKNGENQIPKHPMMQMLEEANVDTNQLIYSQSFDTRA